MKFLLSFIVFIFLFPEGKSEEKKSIKRNLPNYDFPFTEGEGYIPGGIPFKHVIKNEKNELFSMEDPGGKVVILLLFTTWCQNCPVVLRDFDFLVEKFKNQNNLKIIALNIGNESINYLKIHYKANNIQFLDVYHSISPEVFKDVPGVPACLLFDKKGNPVWGYLGIVDYGSPKFIEFMEKLING
ncbi:MAG: TlpA family protein disulfide reductase [Holosporaceae bacterium]|jgi:thiol-disulfide isomerase/thioredoxin|nr:TlpA family protein disulfide reductase [Holosporaceae bacterium]